MQPRDRQRVPVHIARAREKLHRRDRERCVLRPVRQRHRTGHGRRVVDRGQREMRALGDAAAVPVRHGVAERHGTVGVRRRVVAVAAAAEIGERPAAARHMQTRDRKRVAVRIARAREKLRGGDRERHILRAVRQRRRTGDGRRVVSRHLREARGLVDAAAVAVRDGIAQHDRAGGVPGGQVAVGSVSVVGDRAAAADDMQARHGQRVSVDIRGPGEKLGEGDPARRAGDTIRQRDGARHGRRVVDRRHGEPRALVGTAAMAVRDGVAERHRAVGVRRRVVAVAPPAEVGERPAAARHMQARDRQRIAVRVGGAREKLRGRDDAARVLGAVGERHRAGHDRRVVDRRQREMRALGDAAAIAVRDGVAERHRAVGVRRRVVAVAPTTESRQRPAAARHMQARDRQRVAVRVGGAREKLRRRDDPARILGAVGERHGRRGRGGGVREGHRELRRLRDRPALAIGHRIGEHHRIGGTVRGGGRVAVAPVAELGEGALPLRDVQAGDAQGVAVHVGSAREQLRRGDDPRRRAARRRQMDRRGHHGRVVDADHVDGERRAGGGAPLRLRPEAEHVGPVLAGGQGGGMVREIDVGAVRVQQQDAVAPLQHHGIARERHLGGGRIGAGMGGDHAGGRQGRRAEQPLADARRDQGRVLPHGPAPRVEREGRHRILAGRRRRAAGGIGRALAAVRTARSAGAALRLGRACRRGRGGGQHRRLDVRLRQDQVRSGAGPRSPAGRRPLEDRQARRLGDGAEELLDDAELRLHVDGGLRELLEGDLIGAVRAHDGDHAGIGHREQELGRVLAVVDVEAAGMAVRLGHHREGRGAVVGLDGDVHGGAADAHRRDGGADLHVAGLGDLPGDEGDRALDEVEQRGVARARRLVDEVAQEHPRVGGEVEQRPVEEGDRQRRPRPRLHGVALVDEIAHMQRHGDAVAHDGRGAGELLHPADGGRRVRGRSGAGLGGDIPRRRADKARDHGLVEGGSVRRDQPGTVLQGEIVVDDEPVPVPADHEIRAGARVIAPEQERGVVHMDRAAGSGRDLAQGLQPEGRPRGANRDVADRIHETRTAVVPAPRSAPSSSARNARRTVRACWLFHAARAAMSRVRFLLRPSSHRPYSRATRPFVRASTYRAIPDQTKAPLSPHSRTEDISVLEIPARRHA